MSDAAEAQHPTDPELAHLHAELRDVGQVPLEDRVQLFDRANAIVARRLAELDEV